MDKQRFYEYKREIHKLQEKDKQTTLKVQAKFNSMDQKEKEQEKKAREKLLLLKPYEIETDKESYFVHLNMYNDKREKCYRLSLYGEYFEKEMYQNKGFDPRDVYSDGKENIFSGENVDCWEDYEIFEIFHNNIMKFSIKITDY